MRTPTTVSRVSKLLFGACLIQFMALAAPHAAIAQELSTSAVSLSPTPIIAGTDVTYNFSVYNNTGAASTNTSLAINLPAKVKYLANSGACTNAVATVVSCPMGLIADGASADVRVTFHINDDYVVTSGAGFFNFSAVATSTEAPPANTFVGNTAVTELADLQVSNVTTDLTPRAGDIFYYTIYVDNWGPSTARDVVIRDTLLNSDSVSIQSCAYSVSQGAGAITQFTCTTGAVVETQFGTDIGTFRTNFLNSLAQILDDPNTPADETAIRGRLRASFRIVANEDLDLTTDVRAFALTPDPNPANNQQFSEIITVEALADLSLAVAASGELQLGGTSALPFDLLSGDPFPDAAFNTSNIAVTAGRRIRYSYTITNGGVSDAEQVSVLSRLPAGVVPVPGTVAIKFGDGSTAPGSCQFGTPGNPADSMRCSLGTIDADALSTSPSGITGFNVRNVTFDVAVDAALSSGSLLINNVLLESSTLDIDNSDNLGASALVVSPLTGVSGCSTGGTFNAVQCANGSATIDLNGFGFALPDPTSISFQWTSSCPAALFSDPTNAASQLSFTTINPDNSPVSCQVGLTVQNAYATSSCTGNVTVVDCSVDCFGAVGGPAQLDRCGVCEGDGNSCLGCTTVDTSANLVSLTKSALSLRNLNFKAARLLGNPRATRLARKNTKLAFSKTLDAIADIPPSVQSCSNSTFCLQSNNVTLMEAASVGLNDSLVNLQRSARKLGSKQLRKSLVKRGKAAVNAGQEALLVVPVTSSTCS